jgi:hypothetical protein
MHQVEEIDCSQIPELVREKALMDYTARVFQR